MIKNKISINNDFVEIKIQDKNMLIDKEDLSILEKFNGTIYLDKDGYAIIRKQVLNKRKHYRVHRLILNYNGDMQVDHINRNRLDNRKSNLRICEPHINACNKNIKSKTGIRNITYSVINNKKYYRLCVRRNGKLLSKSSKNLNKIITLKEEIINELG